MLCPPNPGLDPGEGGYSGFGPAASAVMASGFPFVRRSFSEGAFVGLELLVHGRVSEMGLERRDAYQAQRGIAGFCRRHG